MSAAAGEAVGLRQDLRSVRCHDLTVVVMFLPRPLDDASPQVKAEFGDDIFIQFVDLLKTFSEQVCTVGTRVREAAPSLVGVPYPTRPAVKAYCSGWVGGCKSALVVSARQSSSTLEIYPSTSPDVRTTIRCAAVGRQCEGLRDCGKRSLLPLVPQQMCRKSEGPPTPLVEHRRALLPPIHRFPLCLTAPFYVSRLTPPPPLPATYVARQF